VFPCTFLFSSFSHFIYAFYVSLLYTVFCLYDEINFIITRPGSRRREVDLFYGDSGALGIVAMAEAAARDYLFYCLWAAAYHRQL